VLWRLCNQVISNERRYSRDSDSDEDVPDELRADYVDERTGDVPPPQKKLVASRYVCHWKHLELMQSCFHTTGTYQ